MATAAENVIAIQAALASGATRVVVDGIVVERRSVAELRQLLAYWQGQAAKDAGAAITRSFRLGTRTGLHG